MYINHIELLNYIIDCFYCLNKVDQYFRGINEFVLIYFLNISISFFMNADINVILCTKNCNNYISIFDANFCHFKELILLFKNIGVLIKNPSNKIGTILSLFSCFKILINQFNKSIWILLVRKPRIIKMDNFQNLVTAGHKKLNIAIRECFKNSNISN